ncbi:extracellular solute-binding protein [Brachybacterium endophyticum]|nr:extracellular solute-binding protein [Brachybacterium endophyticum]
MRARTTIGSPGRGRLIGRRALLGGGAALALSAPLSACSSPLGAGFVGAEVAPETLVFWNLFGGGDGGRMQDMEKVYEKAHGGASALQATTLTWGNPYYSKVTLATEGNQPPDVAVAHLTRAKPLWDGGVLDPISDQDLASVGLSEKDFNAKAWKAQVTDGKTIAIPLDTHPFVMFYNTDVLTKAGLLESDGTLTDLSGIDTFEAALEEIKGVTGAGALTSANVSETATPWRLFWTLYNQHQDATPFLADDGARISVNENLYRDITDRLTRWVSKGWLNRGIDYAGSQTEMATGKAGIYLQGEWEISTFQAIEDLRFGMAPIPTLFDRPAAHADSHTFVLPRKDRTPAQLEQALGFIKTMLEQSMTWAQGGHVPAYLPTFDSAEYAELTPQSDYASAAEHAFYDDAAWYGGSGSTFEDTVGAQLALVQQGAMSPKAALAAIRERLSTYVDTPSPL